MRRIKAFVQASPEAIWEFFLSQLILFPHCHQSSDSVSLEMSMKSTLPPKLQRKGRQSHAFCAWKALSFLSACYLIAVNPCVCHAQRKGEHILWALESLCMPALEVPTWEEAGTTLQMTPLPPKELAGESTKSGTNDTRSCWLAWATDKGGKHTT